GPARRGPRAHHVGEQRGLPGHRDGARRHDGEHRRQHPQHGREPAGLLRPLPARAETSSGGGHGMIRTLDRLVLATFLKLFVVVTVAVPPLFILGDFTENLDLYLDRGLTRAEIGRSYLYKLPEYFQFAFPIAALV